MRSKIRPAEDAADRNVARLLDAYGREPQRVQETVRRVLERARLRAEEFKSSAPGEGGGRAATEETSAAHRGERSTRRQFATLYDELLAAARRLVSRQPPGMLMDAKALVHEAYLVLAAKKRAWNDRDQFLRAATSAMRRALIESVPRVDRCRRQPRIVPLGAENPAARERSAELIALDDALVRLEKYDAVAAKIVEYRTFGSLTTGEIAQRLGICARSVEREWTFARRWLAKELTR